MTNQAVEQKNITSEERWNPLSNSLEAGAGFIEAGTVSIEHLDLLHGGNLSDISVHYNRYGANDRPALVVLGGISSSRDIHEWWADLFGHRKPLDLEQFQVIGVDYIVNNDQQRPSLISSFDQARVISEVLANLDIKHLEAIIGSSYGGMVALAFAHLFPQKLHKLVCIAAAHTNTQTSIAQRQIQQQILQLGVSSGKSQEAVSIARQLGFISYRSQQELESRFNSNRIIEQQNFSNELINYLKYQGDKFAAKFDIERYRCLSQSIDLHKVDPKGVVTDALFIGIDSDQLVPADLIKETANLCSGQSQFKKINSYFGHDGFLLEASQLTESITPFLRNKR
ncbi:homoserine acetyltransferase [Kangiella profundi]|uniref:Homoserine acetyltransferase n=2 Tax=Kangiella profundi TaxID=1561924 RepID=A0A2K9ADY9_9GAMM|nr:homoserine acetyltransferase [Kangiella profundi]GGF09380.1 homoserine O-acetyltransferase [Kangiella profundi]